MRQRIGRDSVATLLAFQPSTAKVRSRCAAQGEKCPNAAPVLGFDGSKRRGHQSDPRGSQYYFTAEKVDFAQISGVRQSVMLTHA